MIKVGDTVKITGLTVNGVGEPVELIQKGTICQVREVIKDNLVEVIPLEFLSYWSCGYCYSIDDVEKGHLEWIRD